MKKKFVCGIFCMGLVVQFILSPATRTYAKEDYQEYVQEELASDARNYMEGELDTIREVIQWSEKAFEIDEEVVERLVFAKPFVVYNIDAASQEETVYFPLVDSATDSIVSVVSLVNTTVGWQYTISKNWVKKLNDCNFLDDEYLFYQSNGNLIAESKKAEYILAGKSVEKNFNKKSFEEKKRIIQNKMRKWEKIDVKKNKESSIDGECKYTPTLGNSSIGEYYCNLYNAQGQGNHGLCWAAAVATTVNYRKGKNYTAKNVAKKMGVGYDEGQNCIEINDALASYGLNYQYFLGVPKYSLMQKSIKKKWPLILHGMGRFGVTTFHSVTVIGYRVVNGNKYLMVWNSAANENEGGVEIATCSETSEANVIFSSGGINYTTFAANYYRSISCK